MTTNADSSPELPEYCRALVILGPALMAAFRMADMDPTPADIDGILQRHRAAMVAGGGPAAHSRGSC